MSDVVPLAERGPVYALSAQTQIRARTLGAERRAQAAEVGRSHRHGPQGDEEALVRDQNAAAAELVIARHLNLALAHVTSAAPDHDGDVTPGVQVRWTPRPRGALILHDSDEDDHFFWLVRGGMPRMEVAGWLLGGEGKLPRYWREDVPHPAYFVAAHRLHPARVRSVEARAG